MHHYISPSFWVLSLQGTGIRIGTIMLATASVVVALAVCFTGSWELTFLVFIAFPLMITSYRVGVSMYRGVQSADSLARASHVVMETTDNIKTVVSLGAEDYFVNSIKDNLRQQLR